MNEEIICPCESEEKDGWYYCERLDTRMNKTWCHNYRNKPKYRIAWDEGRGPGQGDEESPQRVSMTSERLEELKADNKGGPGTELHKLLKSPFAVLKFVFKTKLGCMGSCVEYARKMDRWGVEGCRKRKKEIIQHLESQAKSLKIPFNHKMAGILLKRAIRTAEKKEKEALKKKKEP